MAEQVVSIDTTKIIVRVRRLTVRNAWVTELRLFLTGVEPGAEHEYCCGP